MYIAIVYIRTCIILYPESFNPLHNKFRTKQWDTEMNIETSQRSFPKDSIYHNQNPSIKRHGYLLHAARNIDLEQEVPIKKYIYITSPTSPPSKKLPSHSHSIRLTSILLRHGGINLIVMYWIAELWLVYIVALKLVK